MWLAQSKYEHVWHIEDDAFFTGPWHELFGEYARSTADLVGKLTNVTKGDQHGYKASCRVRRESQGDVAAEHPGDSMLARSEDLWARCFSGRAREPCRHCWTSWPVLRISRRLAQVIKEALMKGAVGHHEALTGAVCARYTWCIRQPFDEARLLGYFLGGEPGFKRSVNSSTRMTLHGINRFLGLPRAVRGTIYHPVKCAASPEAGEQQLAASRWARPTEFPRGLLFRLSKIKATAVEASLELKRPEIVLGHRLIDPTALNAAAKLRNQMHRHKLFRPEYLVQGSYVQASNDTRGPSHMTMALWIDEARLRALPNASDLIGAYHHQIVANNV
eukprot:CAMPEP_0119339132 /NCGR_PEP_ID=MMETSP1333-20130426/97650_1 /TAXON_ID=418940 /ORGANISM="Scyphosphaera apsteinii, Strain RCC1455" /LENGTH=331 /DNA_ID=CAMNT_0007350609 /DNA_START=114 /DNA_END=1109 /DNA_ORIENTATION=-